jgi:hypothetical protein
MQKLKDEFETAVKLVSEKRGTIALEIEPDQATDLKERGFLIFEDQKFSPE